MRKLFDIENMRVHETVSEVRATARKVATAAETQATLNIALTAVSVTALLVAALLVHNAVSKGAGHVR